MTGFSDFGVTLEEATESFKTFSQALHGMPGPQEHEIRITMEQVPTRIAIDLPRHRVFIDCPHQQAYDWIVERFDAWDILAHAYPIVLGRQPLTASDGWTLEFGDRAHPLDWPAPSN